MCVYMCVCVCVYVCVCVCVCVCMCMCVGICNWNNKLTEGLLYLLSPVDIMCVAIATLAI